VLRLAEVPDVTPAAGEVLIRVRATAVNRADLMQRAGNYPPPPGASDIIGLECAGELVAIGDGVDGAQVGDRVMALLSGGGYAELVAVPAGQTMPVPDDMAWEDAAAIPEVFLTAYLTLRILGRLDIGEVALIHSASSGVGTAAIQITRELGARALATSRTAERLQLPQELGAEGILVTDGAFADQVRSHTEGHGADVILDLVGASYWQQNVASLARGGRIILTGLVGGRRVEADLGTLLALQATVIGSTLRGRTTAEKAAIVAEFATWALPRFASGALRPVVHQVLDLAQVADAHRLVGDDHAVGKVVLRVE
jgi:putative PIG3 family NAD(P)H quinone oxidoreductase